MMSLQKSARSHRLLAVNDKGYVIGEQHHRARLTDHEVDLVLELRAAGLSQELVAEKMEISRRTVRDIETGKTRAQTLKDYRPKTDATTTDPCRPRPWLSPAQRQQVRDLRAGGLSQAQTAKHMGITRSAVRGAERADRRKTAA